LTKAYTMAALIHLQRDKDLGYIFIKLETSILAHGKTIIWVMEHIYLRMDKALRVLSRMESKDMVYTDTQMAISMMGNGKTI